MGDDTGQGEIINALQNREPLESEEDEEKDSADSDS